MAIGSKRSRERRKRRGQVLLRLAKWLIMLAVFVGLGIWSYQSGLELARSEVTSLEARLDEVATEARTLHVRNAQLVGELRQSREANAALQRRYDQDVPAGDAAALFSLAQRRIADGLPRARVEQVLRDAQPVSRCEGRGATRRFAIAYGPRVPESGGIELMDGMVRVVVSAPSTADDLARTASVVVNVAGQAPVTLTGLPQRHPVVLGNAELVLTVAPSDVRGFASAGITTC